MFGGSGDPDNPMGGLLGDLMKVIGSGPGAGDHWFEAARSLAFGVATDGGQDETPDPLVRIAFEELARVADDWSLPLQEVQLWVCLRELTMHAVLTRPGVRSSLGTLLGDASAHAA